MELQELMNMKEKVIPDMELQSVHLARKMYMKERIALVPRRGGYCLTSGGYINTECGYSWYRNLTAGCSGHTSYSYNW